MFEDLTRYCRNITYLGLQYYDADYNARADTWDRPTANWFANVHTPGFRKSQVMVYPVNMSELSMLTY